MRTEEYKLLDGRTIRAHYDKLDMTKISRENLESFVKEFNASYRQAKILEKIKENYAILKVDRINELNNIRNEMNKLHMKYYDEFLEDFCNWIIEGIDMCIDIVDTHIEELHNENNK